LLTNVWQLLNSSCRLGKLEPNACGVDQHRKMLVESLSRISEDRNRVNNSLLARTELIFVKLAAGVPNREGAGPLLIELRDAIREARGLIAYLYAYDTERTRDYSTAISVEQVKQMIASISGRKILFFDTCGPSDAPAAR